MNRSGLIRQGSEIVSGININIEAQRFKLFAMVPMEIGKKQDVDFLSSTEFNI